MASHYEAPIRKPLVTGDKTYHDVTVDVAAPVEGVANKQWWIVFGIALTAFLWGVGCIIYTISTGIGTWGLNKTVGWAWDITNFVWWVGIGHAGTLISAVLLLFRQKWRMAINRSAEAMTIFSVIQAGLFPIIHMGQHAGIIQSVITCSRKVSTRNGMIDQTRRAICRHPFTLNKTRHIDHFATFSKT